jgi:hypothetical protein
MPQLLEKRLASELEVNRFVRVGSKEKGLERSTVSDTYLDFGAQHRGLLCSVQISELDE